MVAAASWWSLVASDSPKRGSTFTSIGRRDPWKWPCVRIGEVHRLWRDHRAIHRGLPIRGPNAWLPNGQTPRTIESSWCRNVSLSLMMIHDALNLLEFNDFGPKPFLGDGFLQSGVETRQHGKA